jgi:hypothetical protein
LRLGVLLCVLAAVATAAVKLDDALGIFDRRADLNSESTYGQRTHTHAEWSPLGGRVLENARLSMPEDARYRIVFGPRWNRARTADFTHQLLVGFLLPRRPTTAPTAKWVFCYGCTASTLGDQFEIVDQVQGGPMFSRRAP